MKSGTELSQFQRNFLPFLSFLRQGQRWENSSSVVFVHCDVEMQSTLMALNQRGQGHLMALHKDHLS